MVDFGRELDGDEDVHCLKAMEYLQTGARRSLQETTDAMASYART